MPWARSVAGQLAPQLPRLVILPSLRVTVPGSRRLRCEKRQGTTPVIAARLARVPVFGELLNDLGAERG